jgi:hypothetical protein
MLPFAVKFRTAKHILFRRVFRVVKVKLVQLGEAPGLMWCLTRKNGETVYIPSCGTVIQFGRFVEVIE